MAVTLRFESDEYESYDIKRFFRVRYKLKNYDYFEENKTRNSYFDATVRQDYLDTRTSGCRLFTYSATATVSKRLTISTFKAQM